MEGGFKKIVSDYRKEYWHTPLRYWIITVCDTAGFLLTNSFVKENTRVLAFAVTAALAAASLYVTFDVLFFEPARFKKRLNALPENEREAALSQYEKVSALGKRHFTEEYLIYFAGARIALVKFSEIKSAELKGYKLLLDTGGKKRLSMPFYLDENPAVLMAALRSKNDELGVIINGKVIEKDGKEKT